MSHVLWKYNVTEKYGIFKKGNLISFGAGSESHYRYIGKAFYVLTPQHYHWYAATRFAFPVGYAIAE